MQIIAGFAGFERAMICEWTRASLEQARSKERIGGRRPKLDLRQRAEIVEGVTSGRKSAAAMARLFSISEPTVSCVLAAARQQGNAA